MQKASAQNRAKALKIMRFLGLVVSQWGLFHLPENTFLKKCCKSVAKAVVQKVPSPERHINTGFFGTSKPKGTTPPSTSSSFIQGVFHLFTVILFRTFHSFSCGNFVYVSFCTQIVLRNNAYSNVNISF